MDRNRQAHCADNWPVYWFAKLELAVAAGDHRAAAEAQSELERLSVFVRYGSPFVPCGPSILIPTTASNADAR